MTATAESHAFAPASVVEEIAALKKQSVGQLLERFAALYGTESRSRNRDFLWKRVAWKLQELREGGLSNEALAQAAQLAQGADLRVRPPAGALAAAVEVHKRDPRLPAPGTVLRREHGGEVHEVTVLVDRFEYRGGSFRSLSAVARQITGTAWNGFLWFGLTERGRKEEGI
jgi:hypothetical protein